MEGAWWFGGEYFADEAVYRETCYIRLYTQVIHLRIRLPHVVLPKLIKGGRGIKETETGFPLQPGLVPPHASNEASRSTVGSYSVLTSGSGAGRIQGHVISTTLIM